MSSFRGANGLQYGGQSPETFNKRNRELKRVKATYAISGRNEFEMIYLNFMKNFMSRTEAAKSCKPLITYSLRRMPCAEKRYAMAIIHIITFLCLKIKMKACQSRLIIWSRRYAGGVRRDMSFGGWDAIATTNFEKAHRTSDNGLISFIRKVMEKRLGYPVRKRIIEAYDRIRPISARELKILYILLLYPEKFWKITNFYFNGKKAWVSSRSIQKLSSIGAQNPKREIFLRRLESVL